jgi:hypothetical protein
MGRYSEIDIMRKQGLPEAERSFVTWAIDRATDTFIHGTEPPVQIFDYGIDGTEVEYNESDFVAALLAPVSFAAVVDDICRQLKIATPELVARALGECEPEPVPAA